MDDYHIGYYLASTKIIHKQYLIKSVETQSSPAVRMATRQRGSGAGGDPPVYEDFKPTSEWQQDAESHNLIIHLPGFVKSQLKVSLEGPNIIRVRGERPVAGNKWSRFLEDFQVPENSDIYSVRARFEGGTLKITVPKKSVDKPPEAQPTPQNGQEEVPPAVRASQPKDQKSLETQYASPEPGKKPGDADVQRDRTSTAPFRDAGRVVPQPQDAQGKEIGSVKEKHIGPERADGVTKKTEVKDEKNLERSKELPEDETAGKTKSKAEEGAAATFEAGEKDKETKGKQVGHSSGTDYGAFRMDRYKKAVKELAELEDERQLKVNIGVAVLVIVALSAYVTYKFISGGDKK